MDEKSSDWQSGARMPTVCRCCLADGCYKDISTEYFWMGKKEVYADMLSETFDLSISYPKAEGLSSNSRLICEACISRLRDAAEFKKQVQECEKMFTQHLDPGRACMEIIVEPKEEKFETVKAEKENSDNDDNFNDSIHDDDDDYDELDDEPLTKLATKPMKKENPVIEKLLSTSQITLKRKTPTTAKAPATKKAKKAVATSIKNIKPSASKTASKPAPKTEKKKDGDTRDVERNNAMLLLRYSTAYPFKSDRYKFLCCFCQQTFNDASLFRVHVDSDHPNVDKSVVMKKVNSSVRRVDITNLKCKTCGDGFDTIDQLAKHLVDKYNIGIDMNHWLGLIPFKLDKSLSCAVCNSNFETLMRLLYHTGTHFSSNTCHICGKKYETARGLKTHLLHNHTNQYICRNCRQPFDTRAARKEHIKSNKKCWNTKCGICKERFRYYKLVLKHMEEVHGIKRTFDCLECGQQFDDHMKKYCHFLVTHSSDTTCGYCGMKFTWRKAFKEHVAREHTGERPFKCSYCDKGFISKKGLTNHEATHDDSKKVACNFCPKLFAVKLRLRQHIAKHHPDGLKDNAKELKK